MIQDHVLLKSIKIIDKMFFLEMFLFGDLRTIHCTSLKEHVSHKGMLKTRNMCFVRMMVSCSILPIAVNLFTLSKAKLFKELHFCNPTMLIPYCCENCDPANFLAQMPVHHISYLLDNSLWNICDLSLSL